MTTRKSNRVSLRDDDALTAFCALRHAIEANDQRLAEPGGRAEFIAWLTIHRDEQWQAYQRIAKALGLKPTLTTAPESPAVASARLG